MRHPHLFVAALLAAAGCGSEDKRPASDAPDLREGIITYFDPSPRGRSPQQAAKRPPPTTIVLTTRNEEGETVETSDAVITVTGKVGERSPRDLFRTAAAQKPPRRVISPEDFQSLWKALVAVGLLDLPRHPDAVPPRDRAYIQVQSEGRTIILLRPLAASQEIRSAEERALNSSWHESTVLIADRFSRG
jgi:hypothetical protein